MNFQGRPYLRAMHAREPAVAGRFYPGQPDALRAEVERFLADGAPAEDAIAVIAPHAGYMYSGGIAGEVYAAVRVPDVAIVLCPNHTGAGARAALMSRGAFATPIGVVPIHERLAGLVAAQGGLTEDTRAHAGEHAIEVHLPFLQAKSPGLSFVPICLAGLSVGACLQLGQGLAAAIRALGEPVLLVASTDMSHYIPATVAARLDRVALERIEALDPQGLYEAVVAHDISMCGFIPTTVVLEAARQLGATSARLVRYGNSGETSGDYDHVVGYAGLVIR